MSGGSAWFAVRTRMPDGRLAAAVLEVYLHQYPSSVVTTIERRATGAWLALHVQAAPGDNLGALCPWLGSGARCDYQESGGAWTATYACDLYHTHGNESGDDRQSDEFWSALGAWLRDQVAWELCPTCSGKSFLLLPEGDATRVVACPVCTSPEGGSR